MAEHPATRLAAQTAKAAGQLAEFLDPLRVFSEAGGGRPGTSPLPRPPHCSRNCALQLSTLLHGPRESPRTQHSKACQEKASTRPGA